MISAGPTKLHALAHQIDGKLELGDITLELKPPTGKERTLLRIYAASWNNSGNPPSASTYIIGFYEGTETAVKSSKILRRPPEPNDFWSQSLTWAEMGLWSENPVRIRFTNTEKRPYRKVEAHLAYKITNPTPATVTFAWRNSNGPLQTATHVYAPNAADDATWAFDVGANPKTLWVEYSAK